MKSRNVNLIWEITTKTNKFHYSVGPPNTKTHTHATTKISRALVISWQSGVSGLIEHVIISQLHYSQRLPNAFENFHSIQSTLINEWYFQKQTSRSVLRKSCSENMQQICRRTPMQKRVFIKVALQLYWNHTSTWVFFCKIAAYFQNTFL